MILCAIIIFAVVAVRLCAAEKLDLPATVSICKRDSANYTTCLKRAITNAWPLFAEGFPAEYEFPSIDPLLYGNDVGVFDKGQLHGEVIFKNITCEGYRKARIVAVRARHFGNNNFKLEINLRTPELFVQGSCEAQGTLGRFRMGGKGHFNLTMGSIKDRWVISGFVKNDTWIIEHYRMSPEVKRLKIYLDNFFEGGQELNEVASMFVNEYWPSIFRVVVPIATDHFDKYTTNILNRLFSKLSFSQVFP